jgi:hypothetical protein
VKAYRLTPKLDCATSFAATERGAPLKAISGVTPGWWQDAPRGDRRRLMMRQQPSAGHHQHDGKRNEEDRKQHEGHCRAPKDRRPNLSFAPCRLPADLPWRRLADHCGWQVGRVDGTPATLVCSPARRDSAIGCDPILLECRRAFRPPREFSRESLRCPLDDAARSGTKAKVCLGRAHCLESRLTLGRRELRWSAARCGRRGRPARSAARCGHPAGRARSSWCRIPFGREP